MPRGKCTRPEDSDSDTDSGTTCSESSSDEEWMSAAEEWDVLDEVGESSDEEPMEDARMVLLRRVTLISDSQLNHHVASAEETIAGCRCIPVSGLKIAEARPLLEEILSFPAAHMIIIFVGGNDVFEHRNRNQPPPTVNSGSANTYAEMIRDTFQARVNELKDLVESSPECRLMLCRIPPRKNPDRGELRAWHAVNEVVESTNDEGNVPTPRMDKFLFRMRPNQDPFVRVNKLMPDGVHCTPDTIYKWLAEIALRVSQ